MEHESQMQQVSAGDAAEEYVSDLLNKSGQNLMNEKL